MQQKTFRSKDMRRARTFATALLVTGLWLSGLPPTHADETCMSPYMAKITGQEVVADIGDPSKVPLPVDSTISADDRLLWVNTFMDGTTRAFDISDPFHPTPVYEKRIGSQVNMVSQSWDGKRFYFTSSLLANWDKKVVRFYNRGGHPHPLLDPMIRPLHLTDAEVAALVAFLESLTGDNIAALIADARSVRVGNVTVELPQ